jgi:hypothetical protein
VSWLIAAQFTLDEIAMEAISPLVEGDPGNGNALRKGKAACVTVPPTSLNLVAISRRGIVL